MQDEAEIIRKYRIAVQKGREHGQMRKAIKTFLRALRQDGIPIPDLIREQQGHIRLLNHIVRTYGSVTAEYHALLQLEAELENDAITKLVMMHGGHGSGRTEAAATMVGPNTCVYDAPNTEKSARERVRKLASKYHVALAVVTVLCDTKTMCRRNAKSLDPASDVDVLRSFEATRPLKEGFSDYSIINWR